MNRMQIIVATMALGLTVGLVWCGPGIAAGREHDGQTEERSLTVFPINIKPSMGRTLELRTTMATVVGAFLQRADLKDVELGQTEFTPPDTDDPAKIAADFGRFIVKHPIETQYALFAQYVGTPKTGVKAVVTVVVDRSGKVILAARDTPDTFAKYSNMQPKNPMTCSIFVARRVGKLWKLPDPLRPGAPTDGSMTALLNKESTVPPKAVLAAMKKRLQAMKQGLADRQVTVYPVHLAKGTAPACSEQFVEAINKRGLFKAVAGTTDPSLKVKGNYNQQRVLWGTARAFQKFVKNTPPATDYALYAAYGICGPDVKTKPGMKREAAYVHLIICNKAGELVMVDFQNSHQSDYKKIKPQTCGQCNQLALLRLAARLGK